MAVAPWKLPLIVAAIAVPIAAAFMLGGPAAGVAMGALVAVAIIYIAVRQRPLGPLGRAAGASGPTRLLLVAVAPLEDPGVVAEVAALAAPFAGAAATVLVLAPARIGFLDRWASDVEGARSEAQRSLVITVASLAKAGAEAEARVGDEDVVQAVEDQLQSFDATDVVLVSEGAERDPGAAGAAADLESRLLPRFRWLRLSGPAR